LGCEIVCGDITDRAGLAGICEDVAVVCHMAAIILTREAGDYERVNVGGTLNLLSEARRCGCEHFVYVSSASVTYPRTTPYSRSKRLCEAMVMAQESMPWTVLRPTLVYDEAGAAELYRFWEHLLRFPVAVLVGDGKARKRPVWSEDLGSGIAAALGNQAAFGKIYNLSGAQVVTMEEMAAVLLHRCGVKKPIVKIPASLSLLAAHLVELLPLGSFLSSSALLGILQDADLSPAAAMRDLGYNPLGFEQGLERAGTLPPSRRC
jgi:NADH dehydrogenase